MTDSTGDEPTPVGALLVSVALVLTLSAMRVSMVLLGNPELLSHSSHSSPINKYKERGRGVTNGPLSRFQRHPPPSGVPTRIPARQPARQRDSQPRWAPFPVRTSPLSVHKCPQPPATAFPHPRNRSAAEARRKKPSSPSRCTSVHLSSGLPTRGNGALWRTYAECAV